VIRSSREARADPEKYDDDFESFVFWMLGCFIGMFIIFVTFVPSGRLALIAYLRSVWEGEARKNDPTISTVDKYEELKSRMDPKSTNFIAPGNIYRVTAVMHPGVIGFRSWFLHFLGALVCAFIQLYVSVRIISDFSTEWECIGLKSPTWYSNNALDFLAMLAFTATLNLMFSGKASENIIDDVEANVYILTHQAPPPTKQVTFDLPNIAGAIAESAAEAGRAWNSPRSNNSSNSLLGTTILGTSTQRSADVDYPGRKKGALTKLPTQSPADPMSVPASEVYSPECLKNPDNLYVQEYIWCFISLAINVSTSLMLQVVFALRMMTFSGNLESVVSVAIVLYFIFQLDSTLMDLDPALRPKYRQEVLRRTAERKDKPMWLMRIGALSRSMSTITGWCCLVAYVLLRWRSRRTGMVIGSASR